MGQASIIARGNQLPSAELNLGGTSTSTKVFLNSAGTAVTAILDKDTLAGTPGKAFSRIRVVAAGRVTGGGSTNFTPTLYWGTSTTTASNTALCTGATVAVNSVSGTWEIDAELCIDYTSVKITGNFANQISGSTTTFTARAAVTNAITASSTPALSFTTATPQGFCAAGAFSSGFAGNIAYLDVLQIEMVG